MNTYATHIAAGMLFVAAWLLFVAGQTLYAQPDPIESPPTAGTSFIVAFPDTTANTTDPRWPSSRTVVSALQLYVYSAANSSVTVTAAPDFRLDTTVNAGEFTVISLPTWHPTLKSIANLACEPTTRGVFRVTSSSPVILYQYMATFAGTEAWTPMPVETWGSEYFAAGLAGEVGIDVAPGGEFDYKAQRKMFPAEIVVIAAYDDTRITITPNGRVNECSNLEVTLNAGECYLIHSWVDTSETPSVQPDFGGTRIVASAPVGVISGNTRAMAYDHAGGLARNSFKNMQMEWVPPSDYAGTEFVYMPTSDSHRPTGAPGEDPNGTRRVEHVRVYGVTPGATGASFYDNGTLLPVAKQFGPGEFATVSRLPRIARVFRTDAPAQVMMHSSAAVRYAGTTTTYGDVIGTAYDAWGGYMVEMTPREHWVDFAPLIAPQTPTPMEHFLNVVTDTLHRNDVYFETGDRFVFDQGVIAGTDLIWGTMRIDSALGHTLKGRNGARFYGFVYGLRRGHEQYRPGMIRPGDPPRDPAAHRDPSDADLASAVLHPSEYEEWLGVSYGYPLAPARVAAEKVILDPAWEMDFGEVSSGESVTDTLSVRNVSPDAHVISSIDLALGNRGFTVLSPTDLPVTLPQGEEIDVRVSFTMPSAQPPLPPFGKATVAGEVVDTLIIVGTFGTNRIVLRASSPPASIAGAIDALAPRLDVVPSSFSHTAVIVVETPVPGAARITVVDAAGTQVAEILTGNISRGQRRIGFDASELPSGMYFCRLQLGGRVALRPFVVGR